MAQEKRTLLKNVNRDLLFDELSTSALPFIVGSLPGFDRITEFEGAPRAENKIVSRVRQSDGSYIEDIAVPGELRFEFATELTGAEDVALDALLAAHDSTQRTAEQQRENQDRADLDTLIANFPNWDSFNNTQRNNFLKMLARVVLRERRASPF